MPSFLDESIAIYKSLSLLPNVASFDLGFEMLEHYFGVGEFYETSSKTIVPKAFSQSEPSAVCTLMLLSRRSARLLEAVRNLAVYGGKRELFEGVLMQINAEGGAYEEALLIAAGIVSFFDVYDEAPQLRDTQANARLINFLTAPLLSTNRVSVTALDRGVVVPMMKSRPTKFTVTDKSTTVQ